MQVGTNGTTSEQITCCQRGIHYSVLKWSQVKLQDLNEGKLTWPLIIACERSPDIAKQVIEYANAHTEISDENVVQLLTAIRETGAIEETRLEAARYADKAHQALKKLPEGESSRALATVVQTALHRRK